MLYKKFFSLANQYKVSFDLLLDTMVLNENKSIGTGDTPEEAEINFKNAIIKSDAYLMIPALFTSLQSAELFLKGMLLLNGRNIKTKHEVSYSLDVLKEIYGEKSKEYNCFNKYYKNSIGIIEAFKKSNSITTTNELYLSLRYPCSKGKEYEYFDLRFNGKKIINQYIKLKKDLDEISNIVQLKYNDKIMYLARKH